MQVILEFCHSENSDLDKKVSLVMAYLFRSLCASHLTPKTKRQLHHNNWRSD
jgi:hypothetical protein